MWRALQHGKKGALLHVQLAGSVRHRPGALTHMACAPQ